MKKLQLYLIYIGFNLLINLSVSIWYFLFDGYLGLGFGELIYIGFILIVMIINIFILVFHRKTPIYYKGLIFCLCLLYDIWLFNLLYNVPKVYWTSHPTHSPTPQLAPKTPPTKTP
jgi:hypothetical protein